MSRGLRLVGLSLILLLLVSGSTHRKYDVDSMPSRTWPPPGLAVPGGEFALWNSYPLMHEYPLHVIDDWFQGSRHLLVLVWLEPVPLKEPRFRCLAALDLGELARDQEVVAPGDCVRAVDRQRDWDVVAVRRSGTRGDLAAPLRAWRVDRRRGSFVGLSPDSVLCNPDMVKT
jgi:hypothetical protein